MGLVKEDFPADILEKNTIGDLAKDLIVHGDSLQTSINIVNAAQEHIQGFTDLSEEDVINLTDLIDQIIRYYAVTHEKSEIPFEE